MRPDGGRSIVVCSGTLGDWMMAQWLLRALSARGAVWAVTDWAAAQWSAHRIPGVVAVDGEQPRWSRLHAPTPLDPDGDLRDALASAHRIIAFNARPDDAWATNVAHLAPDAARVFIAPRPPVDWPAHVTDYHAAVLTKSGCPLGTPADWPAPGRTAGIADTDTADADVAVIDGFGPVVLHPGSGAQAKCWPAERFAALARVILGRGRAVRIVLGDAERSRWTEAVIRRWRADFDVCMPATLAELHAVLSRAALFVGNDSGPTRLAAEIGVPTVALFGPTSPATWRPLGADVTVLAPSAPSPMTWLAVDQAIEAVAAILSRPV